MLRVINLSRCLPVTQFSLFTSLTSLISHHHIASPGIISNKNVNHIQKDSRATRDSHLSTTSDKIIIKLIFHLTNEGRHSHEHDKVSADQVLSLST